MTGDLFRRRVIVSAAVFAVASLFLIGKVATLHFSDKIILEKKAAPEVRRGMIKDSRGHVLAMSIESHSLFATPREIEDPRSTARALAPLLAMPAGQIEEALTGDRHFVWIRRKLDDHTRERILALDVRGLRFRKEPLRVYPHKNLASNIIGFVGMDNTGLEGIEYSYEAVLSARGRMQGSSQHALVRGDNLWLTIDRFIQHVAEREVERSVLHHGAKQGAVLVMEVATGRILALAHYPSFDPNVYFRYSPFMRRNFSVIDSFEPGSTMKVLSLAALLEHGRSFQGKRFNCEGSVVIGDTTINCTGVHGSLDIEGVISRSCNVGVIKAMKELGKDELYATLARFGFGRKACGDFPGETEGIFRPTARWSGLSKYSISIGQELSVTSLQMGAAFCAVANDGIMNMPSIIEAVESPEGELIQTFYPRTRGRVISSATAATLMKLMRSVVTRGTGLMAASAYYDAVGKTGTSQKFIRQSGVYSDRVIASFVGIAPYERPEICVLVLIDDPVDKLSGGVIAAPVFSRIIDAALPYSGVKKGASSGRLPIHKKERHLYSGGATMPDFRGAGLARSLDALVALQREWDIEYRISGSGGVYEQSPRAGTPLSRKQKIILYLK